MKIIRKSLLALLLGLSLTACGISRNKIINTEFTRATEAESPIQQTIRELLSGYLKTVLNYLRLVL